MKYISTRNRQIEVCASQAIAQGISEEGGLFVPQMLPKLTKERLASLVEQSYIARAQNILADFLTDFTPEEIEQCVQGAYGGGRFASEKVAPGVQLDADTWMLELWHGPTCAFKDMALQLLPHLLTRASKKVALATQQPQRETVILVATSGDTGKAALEGFRDVAGTRILVFYPQDGVSEVQKLQMVTQEGENVDVCGVDGNFDDTQTAVKKIFTDPVIRADMQAKGMVFSSANSINWGRLVPQIVYYVSAYCDLVQNGAIALGENINVAVPTGNFGNILAAYYAKHMGVPIGKLICASNKNHVLTDFIRTGQYDRRRTFHMTTSPSMDILISSNLERLLYALCEDDQTVADWMKDLTANGVYSVSPAVKEKLQAEFYAGFCEEEQVLETIRTVWEKQGYLMDTHTAVGFAVREQYRKETGDNTVTIVASTANPYKFSPSILRALQGESGQVDEFAQAFMLSAHTNTRIPQQILALQDQPRRFETSCAKDQIAAFVKKTLDL